MEPKPIELEVKTRKQLYEIIESLQAELEIVTKDRDNRLKSVIDLENTIGQLLAELGEAQFDLSKIYAEALFCQNFGIRLQFLSWILEKTEKYYKE